MAFGYPVTIPVFIADPQGPCIPESVGVSFSPLSLNDITTILEAANPDDQVRFRRAVVDIDALQNAVDTTDDPSRGAFTHSLKVVSNDDLPGAPQFISDFLDAVSTPGLVDIINRWLGKFFELVDIKAQVKFVSSGPCGLTVGYTSPNEIDVVLTLTPDCAGGGGGTEVGIYTLQLPGCADLPPTEIDIASPITPDPHQPGQFIFEGAGLQVIVNLLSRLLRCCNPCGVNDWKFGPTFADVLEFRPERGLTAVKLDVQSNPDPARIAWNPPMTTELGGVQRFGKFQFIYADGDAGPLDFLNFQQQVAYPEYAGCIGINIYLNDGVHAVVQYQQQDEWKGNTYTP
jgi:hypothetical protein